MTGGGFDEITCFGRHLDDEDVIVGTGVEEAVRSGFDDLAKELGFEGEGESDRATPQGYSKKSQIFVRV